MKTTLMITGLALFVLFGCTEKNNIVDIPTSKIPELSKTEYYGCIGQREKKAGDYGMDTIFYQERNDTLILIINLVRNCGFQLTDSLSLTVDTANIYIDLNGLGNLGCICDFEFNYYFTDYGNNLQFNVYTRYPDWGETEYTFWNDLTYP